MKQILVSALPIFTNHTSHLWTVGEISLEQFHVGVLCVLYLGGNPPVCFFPFSEIGCVAMDYKSFDSALIVGL